MFSVQEPPPHNAPRHALASVRNKLGQLCYSQVVVDAETLERHLAEIQAGCVDPRAGLYGPDSMSWRVGREAVVMLGGGRASLLQLAHPWVAHAVDQHSDTRNNPIGRFNRTFTHVFAMVFGELHVALGSSRRVFRLHQTIKGTATEETSPFPKDYFANAPDALLWVQATLIEGSVQAYEIAIGPLTLAEKAQYYEEAKLFGKLFGIPQSLYPEDWTAFEAYFEDMTHQLRVGRPAQEMSELLFTPPHLAGKPVYHWYRTMTAGLMPEPLREPYNLRFGRRERLLYASGKGALRRAWRLVPGRIRFQPAYIEALRRLEGSPSPDRFGRALEQLVLWGMAPRGVSSARS